MHDLTDLYITSITLKHLPCIPCLMSFSQSPALHTMSKALRKSINAQNSFFLEFNTESIKHLRLNICSVVEYPFLKPACACDKMFSSSTNFVILSLIMDGSDVFTHKHIESPASSYSCSQAHMYEINYIDRQ